MLLDLNVMFADLKASIAIFTLTILTIDGKGS